MTSRLDFSSNRNPGQKTATENFQTPTCPPAEEGIHTWLMRASWASLKAGLTPDSIAEELEAPMTRPQKSQSEIDDSIRSVSLRQRWVMRGKRLFDVTSVRAYLNSLGGGK
jgi:hypothetical protein